jgi:hypothetical protein
MHLGAEEWHGSHGSHPHADDSGKENYGYLESAPTSSCSDGRFEVGERRVIVSRPRYMAAPHVMPRDMVRAIVALPQLLHRQC